jgi:hypothetical protein
MKAVAERSVEWWLPRSGELAMNYHENFSFTNSPQSKQVQSDQSSSHILGLAVTAVFVVMLILNAISY